MKYAVGQRVIDIEDCETGVITAIDLADKRGPYTVQLDSGNVFQYTDRLLRRDSDELQAENERLKAVIADAKRVATGLYECAPTEGVTELLYYLSVMQREFDLALAGSEE